MQQQQLLDIFCSSMQQFEEAMTHLQQREEALNRQTRRLVVGVMAALTLVLAGIGYQVWTFTSSMGNVVTDINNLTKNVGYTQGILHGMKNSVLAMEKSIVVVPEMASTVSAFNDIMPLMVADVQLIHDQMNGFHGSMAQLDYTLSGMNGTMAHMNHTLVLMRDNTRQFARMMP